MTKFRLDISRETGEAILWMATTETACGFRPILGWPSIDGVKEFGEMLLDIYHHRSRERDRVRQVSERIVKQALGEQVDCLREEFDD
jgi:hypothetical protein